MEIGILFVVATPIGNLEDITLRALRILREVDVIACEDTRHTAKLLSHFGIKTPLESHHEHNEKVHAKRVIDLLRGGKRVALVADAGTPLISDPGFSLIEACRREQIPVVPVPGPSAAIAALSASGLRTDSFYFAGFLPPRSSQRRKRLAELAGLQCTVVIYEAPHRILGALEDINDILGPRRASLARELSKVHEEWLYGTIQEILDLLRARPEIKGEITLVIDRGEPHQAAQTWPTSLREHLDQEIANSGADRKQALKAVARQRGISRREAYSLLLTEEGKGT